ncbi:MAG: DUF1963 domain-containing protein [Alphaproteobacteria bacterium]
MKFPRTLTVFLCATGGIFTVALCKALFIRGLDKLPPWKTMVFASLMCGVLAALVDWFLLRGILPVKREEPQPAPRAAPPAQAPQPQAALPPSPAIAQARRNPIVFRVICPPPAAAGLSFYGGLPVGPAGMAWPRMRKEKGGAPLSFIMQWDCAALSAQDSTGLLPKTGALYLFADLNWGDPFDFSFCHAPGPADGWQPLKQPAGLPPVYGDNGAYSVPYCTELVDKQKQDVPRVMPKWPFTPLALAAGESDFWDEQQTGEALLRLQHHPAPAPAAVRLDEKPPAFARPFPQFPHDYAAVRIMAKRVLKQLRHPSNYLLRDMDAAAREALLQRWRDEALGHYEQAATHPAAATLEQSSSDSLWQWMEGLEPVLKPGFQRIVEDSANASLGLGNAALLPASLVAACAARHQLARAYLHDEHPKWGNPAEKAAWDARKAEGKLKEVRSLHANSPNRIFGGPSYVQGYAEEYIGKWLLLLELSSCEPIGHEFGEGVLQFMIRPADLQGGRFDQVKLVASAY